MLQCPETFVQSLFDREYSEKCLRIIISDLLTVELNTGMLNYYHAAADRMDNILS